MLLCFFLPLKLNRVVKRLCYLSSLSGKYICLNVYCRPTSNRLNMGGGEPLSFKLGCCAFEVKALRVYL